MTPAARDKRFTALRELGCITCPGGGRVEIHHLNADGKAGQKRRGDEYTIPLCEWAHRGVILFGMTKTSMEIMFGPSLARTSKSFRAKYGSDDELLAKTNERIGEVTA